MTNVNLEAETIKVHPREFLETIFGEHWSDAAWVASVATLAPGAQTNRDFFGRRGRGFNDWDYARDCNCYYSMGAIQDTAGASRKSQYWSYGPVVVLDDVGEKCAAGKVLEAFGEPSFIVQTSPGSEQWGYILTEPVRDPLVMARLMRACTLAFYPSGKDPGHEPIVQYVRLPWGVNSKTKRVAENGGVAPRVTLIHWEPHRKVDALDLMLALGDAWTEAEHDIGRSGSEFVGPRTIDEARTFEEADEILQGLDTLGMVHWDHLQNGGYIEVDCPWASEHAVADDRTGYNPALAPTGHGFWCFHGSHGPKVDADVREWLETELGAQTWKGICDEVFEKRAGDVPFKTDDLAGVDLMQYVSPQVRVIIETPRQPPRPLQFTEWGKGVPVEALPVRRLICYLAERGQASILTAQGGTGKSLLAIALGTALSLDSEKSGELIGSKKPLDYTGRVYYVSNEDDDQEVLRRRNGWLVQHLLSDTDLKHHNILLGKRNFVAVQRADRHSTPELAPAMGQLADAINSDRAHGQDVCLVVFDTLASICAGIEENDNSAMHAAIDLIGSWARDNDVAVLVIHHMSKAGKGGTDLNSIRGASAIGAAFRMAYNLLPLTDDEKDRVSLDEADRWLRLVPVKANHYRPGDVRWFYKETVKLPAYDPRSPEAIPMEEVGVLVYRDKPPITIFNPNDENQVLQVVGHVCDSWDATNEDAKPLAVKGRTTSFKHARKFISEIEKCTPEQAQRTLDEAVRLGFIKVTDEWSKSGHKVEVYAPTELGAQKVEERRSTLPF